MKFFLSVCGWFISCLLCLTIVFFNTVQVFWYKKGADGGEESIKQKDKTERYTYPHMRDTALLDNDPMACPNEAHIHALNVLLSWTQLQNVARNENERWHRSHLITTLYGCSHLVKISEVRHLWFTVVAFSIPSEVLKTSGVKLRAVQCQEHTVRSLFTSLVDYVCNMVVSVGGVKLAV